MQGPLAKPIGHAARFTVGLVLGFLVVPVSVVSVGFLAIAVLGALSPGPTDEPGPLVFAASGADLSAAGAVSVAITHAGDIARLTCRGGCDDLRIEERRGGLAKVRVVGASGDCIACRETDQARPGNSWSLRGRPQLALVRTSSP